MAFTFDIRRHDTGLAAHLRSAMASIRTLRARRAAYRQTYDELNALSARELNDLGISRSDIPAIAREAAQET